MTDDGRAACERLAPGLEIRRGIGTVRVLGSNEDSLERARELARTLRAGGFDVPDVAVGHADEDGVEFFVGTCRTATIEAGDRRRASPRRRRSQYKG